MSALVPWSPLRAALRPSQRAAVGELIAALLRWQRGLRGWPPPMRGLPDATPFVSLYAGGRLTGCFGSDEGSPDERLRRAFLRALEDIRFGPLQSHERERLVAQISWPTRAGGVALARLPSTLELGSHGLSWSSAAGPVLVLPHVARDGALDQERLLASLANKAGQPREALATGAITLFETEDLVIDGGGLVVAPRDSLDAARRFLVRMIDARGHIPFAVDARSGLVRRSGPMQHGRAAVVLAALRGSENPHVERARRRLTRDIADGLRGKAIADWPEHPSVVAGTLALACLAGLPFQRELRALVESDSAALALAWHLGQVALALGEQTPEPVWRAMVASLEREPWAPWALLAARARGDAKLVRRLESTVSRSLRARGPHLGGADVTPTPELALTALAVESLQSPCTLAARRAALRGRTFLQRWQHGVSPRGLAERGAIVAARVEGAFPISPIVDAVRLDVTAHCVLALSRPSPAALPAFDQSRSGP